LLAILDPIDPPAPVIRILSDFSVPPKAACTCKFASDLPITFSSEGVSEGRCSSRTYKDSVCKTCQALFFN
ncbi:MAG: hypothetical protein EBU33_11130, partial [Sphingobacteriia bacterium]|nr:hypothetical protein [Sphingobacteriia bacterium]